MLFLLAIPKSLLILKEFLYTSLYSFCISIYIYIGHSNYLCIYVTVCTDTEGYVCVRFCMFLYVPVRSCMFLYVPVRSCMFLYVPVGSCRFLYVLLHLSPFFPCSTHWYTACDVSLGSTLVGVPAAVCCVCSHVH